MLNFEYTYDEEYSLLEPRQSYTQWKIFTNIILNGKMGQNHNTKTKYNNVSLNNEVCSLLTSCMVLIGLVSIT